MKNAWTSFAIYTITAVSIAATACGCGQPTALDADGRGWIVGKVYWKSNGTIYLVGTKNGRVFCTTMQPPPEAYAMMSVGDRSAVWFEVREVTNPSGPQGPGINEAAPGNPLFERPASRPATQSAQTQIVRLEDLAP